MLKGAVRTIGKPIEGLKQTRVSIDGSWQKPEHVSPNGIVTAVSGDKCVDIEILTEYCSGCKIWKDKKGMRITNAGLLIISAK